MTMLKIRCHGCGQRYKVPDTFAFKVVRCRHCGHGIRVSEDVSYWLGVVADVSRGEAAEPELRESQVAGA